MIKLTEDEQRKRIAKVLEPVDTVAPAILAVSTYLKETLRVDSALLTAPSVIRLMCVMNILESPLVNGLHLCRRIR